MSNKSKRKPKDFSMHEAVSVAMTISHPAAGEPTVDAVPRELFDKLLKDMCEMCFMWGDGLCPFCEWKEYRTDADEPAGA